MRLDPVPHKILWACIEDFVGLWEIHWEINSLHPENSFEENRAIGIEILSDLLMNGLVDVYSDVWGSDKLTLVKKSDGIKLLEDDQSWSSPTISQPCVKIGNTDKGLKVYKKIPKQPATNNLIHSGCARYGTSEANAYLSICDRI